MESLGGSGNNSQVPKRPERPIGKGWTELRSPKADVFAGNGNSNFNANEIWSGAKGEHEINVLKKPDGAYRG